MGSEFGEGIKDSLEFSSKGSNEFLESGVTIINLYDSDLWLHKIHPAFARNNFYSFFIQSIQEQVYSFGRLEVGDLSF